jgi:hypothetical protein
MSIAPNACRAAVLALTLVLSGCAEGWDDYDYYDDDYPSEPVPQSCYESQEGNAGDWHWYTNGFSSSATGDYRLTPRTVNGLAIDFYAVQKEFPWFVSVVAGPLNAGGLPVFKTVTAYVFNGERAIPPFNLDVHADSNYGWIYEFKLKAEEMPVTRLVLKSGDQTVLDIAVPTTGSDEAVSQATAAALQVRKKKTADGCQG